MRDRTYAGGEARMMQNPRQPSGVHKRGSQKAPDAAALSSVKPDGKSGRNLLGEVVVVVRILTNDQIHQASQQQDGNRRRNGEASTAEE